MRIARRVRSPSTMLAEYCRLAMSRTKWFQASQKPSSRNARATATRTGTIHQAIGAAACGGSAPPGCVVVARGGGGGGAAAGVPRGAGAAAIGAATGPRKEASPDASAGTKRPSVAAAWRATSASPEIPAGTRPQPARTTPSSSTRICSASPTTSARRSSGPASGSSSRPSTGAIAAASRASASVRRSAESEAMGCGSPAPVPYQVIAPAPEIGSAKTCPAPARPRAASSAWRRSCCAVTARPSRASGAKCASSVFRRKRGAAILVCPSFSPPGARPGRPWTVARRVRRGPRQFCP